MKKIFINLQIDILCRVLNMQENNLIRFEVGGVVDYDKNEEPAVLVLRSADDEYQLPIAMGAREIASIIFALRREQPVRPLTHDMFKDFLIKSNCKVSYVILKDFNAGVFAASMHFMYADGTSIEVDSRASDAIAMAIRFNAEIFCDKNVLEKANAYLETERPMNDDEDDFFDDEILRQLSMEELEEKMLSAVAQEDYSAAIRFRDEKNKRINNNA
ncbi:MAG: bifunctional nuclease family protein [Bacteroidales bacterium]|nr:bifunctional nuclease family protein [Bacteroidales bacterium]